MAKLSPVKIIMINLSSTIGSGVVFAHTYLRSGLETPLHVFLVFITAAALALIQSQCYAELAEIVPGKGGDSVYLAKAFSEKMAYFYNLFTSFVILPSIAAQGFFKATEALGIKHPVFYFLLILATLPIFFVSERMRMGIIQALFIIKALSIAGIASLLLYFMSNSPPNAWVKISTSSGFSFQNAVIAFATCTYFFSGYNTCNFTHSGSNYYWPYALSVVISALIYAFFMFGNYLLFSQEELFNSYGKLQFPLNFIRQVIETGKGGASYFPLLSHFSSAIICILNIGPAIGNHTIFKGIQEGYSTKPPSHLYFIYGLIVFLIMYFGSADDIISYVSILMSLFYCLTFVAHLKLRKGHSGVYPIFVPLTALMVSLGMTLFAGYEFYKNKIVHWTGI